MQTLRSAISDILNDLKAINLDDRFSFRFLANKIIDNINHFIKQDADARALFNINEIWKPVYPIKLVESNYNVDSSFYEGCDILMKSVKKIPEVYTTKYGNLIKILNVNNSTEYKQIKSFEYKDIKRREFRNKKIKYFWIEDGYLYIPDTQVEEVRGLGVFKYSQEADYFNDTCDVCFKPLDSMILAPDYIIKLAKQQVLTELASITTRMISDDKPNLNSLDKGQ